MFDYIRIFFVGKYLYEYSSDFRVVNFFIFFFIFFKIIVIIFSLDYFNQYKEGSFFRRLRKIRAYFFDSIVVEVINYYVFTLVFIFFFFEFMMFYFLTFYFFYINHNLFFWAIIYVIFVFLPIYFLTKYTIDTIHNYIPETFFSIYRNLNLIYFFFFFTQSSIIMFILKNENNLGVFFCFWFFYVCLRFWRYRKNFLHGKNFKEKMIFIYPGFKDLETEKIEDPFFILEVIFYFYCFLIYCHFWSTVFF